MEAGAAQRLATWRDALCSPPGDFSRDPASGFLPGSARDPARTWVLLYPQALQSALGDALRRQFAHVAAAPDGLLTLAKVRSAAQSFWQSCHASACADAPPTTLLAIGGGSVMDLAKVMRWLPTAARCAALAKVDDETWYAQIVEGLAQADRLHLIVLPTTAGTGSEATPYATLWGRYKISFHHPQAFADLAVVDYHLTLGTPWILTRDSALDALSHALDVLWHRASDAALQATAADLAQQIVAALERLHDSLGAPEGQEDHNARCAMARASLLAGQLIARTESSLVHALSYPLTLREGLTHGLACAQWIAAVAALACEASPGVARHLDAIWGVAGMRAKEEAAHGPDHAPDLAPAHQPAHAQDLAHAHQAAHAQDLAHAHQPAQRACAKLLARITAWLAALGVPSRHFSDEAGKTALAIARKHPRGRNFLDTQEPDTGTAMPHAAATG